MCVCDGSCLTEARALIRWQQLCRAVQTTKSEFTLSLCADFSQLVLSYTNFRSEVACVSGASHSNSSTSLQTGGVVFGGSKDGMHQRSFSVSSADQWNDAINTSTSSGARKTYALFFNITSLLNTSQSHSILLQSVK